MNTIVNPFSPAAPIPYKSLVLVGMPGAGKSSIGRKLAAHLSLPFSDSDAAIEEAAGMKISQLIEQYGENEMRAGERRVIRRLLEGAPRVLSTGGETFLDEECRRLIKENSLSIWLRVDPESLNRRLARRSQRNKTPRADVATMLALREPIYALADVEVSTDDRPADETVVQVIQALTANIKPDSDAPLA